MTLAEGLRKLMRAALIPFWIGCLQGLATGRAQTGAAEYVIRTWSTEDGLPQHSATALTQTSDGYIWVGTFNGLSRFNGMTFKRFTVANTPEFQADDITFLYEDRSRRLWIGTYTGVISYYNGRFERLARPGNLDRSDVLSMVERPDGTLFVASDRGIYRRLPSGTVEEVAIPEAVWPTSASRVACDQRGTVWVVHGDRLFKVEGERVVQTGNLPGTVELLANDREGSIWCGLSGGGLIQLTPDGLLRPAPFRISRVRDLIESARGDLWIATEREGLYRWRDGQLLHITTEDGLHNNRLLDLEEDSEGNIWAGTDGGGFSRLKPKQLRNYSVREGIPHPDVASVAEDGDGRIWVGTFGAAAAVGREGAWTPFVTDGLIRKDEAVISVCRTHDGSILFGRVEGPLYRLRNGILEEDWRSHLRTVRVLFEDSQRNVWTGSSREGVECIKNGTVERWNTTNGLSDDYVTGITESEGTIWIGTGSGLNRLHQGRIDRFTTADGLGGNVINSLLAGEDGVLWIGTAGGGLTRYKNGSFQSVNSRHGLFSDVIGQILEDGADLWIGSNLGIFRVRKEAITDVMEGRQRVFGCTAFSRKDGMQSEGCPGGYQPACMKSKDGRLWFSTSGGLVVVDPAKVAGNSFPPHLHIEQLQVDGVEVTNLPPSKIYVRHPGRESIPVPGEARKGPALPIVIQRGANRLEFHCAGLSLSAPEQVRYRYRLEGYEDDWQEAGTRSVAYYSHLAPGHYRFLAYAGNDFGVWTSVPAELEIVVQPQFWQAFWFQALAAGTLLSLAGGIVYTYMAGRRSVEELRLKVARDLHDEVSSNLGNIAMLTQLAEAPPAATSTLTGSNGDLAEIREVALQTIDSVRDVTWFINPAFDTLEGMRTHLEQVARRMLKGKQVEIRIAPGDAAARLSFAFRRNVFLIVKETLHNIVKHSGSTRVEIDAESSGGWFNLSIRDNGEGFDPAVIARGSGLKNMRARAEELRGSLTVTSHPRGGTTVNLATPMAQMRHWRMRGSIAKAGRSSKVI